MRIASQAYTERLPLASSVTEFMPLMMQRYNMGETSGRYVHQYINKTSLRKKNLCFNFKHRLKFTC